MIPILYERTETDFTTQGIGALSDAISCNVINQINSTYELDMVYPIDGVHYSDIQEGRIILATHDETGETEPFEIYAISAPMNGKVIINAWHISYRLAGIVAFPFTGSSLVISLTAFKQAASATCPFNFYTTKSVNKPITIEKPTPMRTVMGGMEGSYIDTYGGEWEFSRWDCTLKNRIGQDTNVVISYGKNLTDAKKKVDISNLWTGIIPYYSGEDGTICYNGVIYSSLASQIGREMTIAIDATDGFESIPTQAQLKTWGENYVAANAKTEIPQSITISFVQLWQTKEYEQFASLQRLFLGDGVTVYHELLGIDISARIVKVNYNVLLDRYDGMTIGSVSSNIAQSVQTTVNTAVKSVPSKDWFNSRLVEATQAITGGLGGYVVQKMNANNQPEEILIMDTPDITTAVNIIRMNKAGIGFSQTGYNGTFNSAWLINGTMDMSQINVINLSASAINTGILKDSATNGTLFYLNTDTGEVHIKSIEDNVLSNQNSISELYQSFDNTTEELTSVKGSVTSLSSDLSDFKQETSTTISQTADRIEFDFDQRITQANNAISENSSELADIHRYIRFVNGNIELGEEGSPIKQVIQNDRDSFYYNGVEVAYISDNKLYITEAQILSGIVIGKHKWLARGDRMTLVYTG